MRQIIKIAGIIICCLLATNTMAAADKKQDARAVLHNGNHCVQLAPTTSFQSINGNEAWGAGVELVFVHKALRLSGEYQNAQFQKLIDRSFWNIGIGVCPIPNPNIKFRPTLSAKVGMGSQLTYQCFEVGTDINTENLNFNESIVRVNQIYKHKLQTRLELGFDIVCGRVVTLNVKGGALWNPFEGAQIWSENSTTQDLNNPESWEITVQNVPVEKLPELIGAQLPTEKWGWYLGASIKFRLF